MRKIKEIRQELAATLNEYSKASEENREPMLNKIGDLTKELNDAETYEAAQQKLQQATIEQKQKEAGRKFSFLKFINELSSEKGLTGLEAEIVEMGAEEANRLGLPVNGAYLPSSLLRAAAGQNYTTAGDGGNLIETGSIRYLDALKDKLVLNKLGATYLGNLIGSIPFITDSNVTASWVAEAAADSGAAKVAFSKATMTPKRATITGAFTKDLLRQTSLDVENIVMNKIVEAHARLLESSAINGDGTTGPKGILATTGIGSVEGGTNGAAINWKNVVALETAVNEKNAGGATNMAYLTNASVIGALKTTEMAANTARFMLDPMVSTLNGYKIDWTNLVPKNLTKGTASSKCSAMIFGNFSDLYIGQWGGIDVVVDPYSKKKTAEVEITLNAWHDVLVARPESFAAIKDITVA